MSCSDSELTYRPESSQNPRDPQHGAPQPDPVGNHNNPLDILAAPRPDIPLLVHPKIDRVVHTLFWPSAVHKLCLRAPIPPVLQPRWLPATRWRGP